MDTHPVAWRPLGTHLVRVIEDALFLQVHGILHVSDLRELTGIGLGIVVHYGYYLSIVDATLGTTMTAEARRFNAQWMRENPHAVGVSVVYGASLVVRTVITMIIRATTLLSMRPAAAHFVADEAAVLECAAVERQRLRTQVGGRPPPT